MTSRKKMIKRSVQAVWFAAIVLVVCLSLTPRMEIPYTFCGADKLCHFMAYTWLALLPFFGFEEIRQAFTGAFLMIPVGIGLEVAQHFVPGRDFSAADMIANAAGVALGIILARHIKKSRLPSQARIERGNFCS